MSMPLEGLRVVDVTILLQGPAATAMLGDLGAEVIKVEERTGGDITRGFWSMYGVPMEYGNGRNWVVDNLNRNKKGITLDLRKDEARQVLYELVKKSDIFVENFRVGVAKKLGLDYEVLRQHNPKLIYASASPWGPRGPEAAKPAMDPIIAARCGFVHQLCTEGEPYYGILPGMCDQTGGLMLAYAIMAAVVARERLGVGQKVEVSSLASMTWLQSQTVQGCLITGKTPVRGSRYDLIFPLNNSYRGSDGKWFQLNLVRHDYWPPFCKALGHEELENDPRFDTVDNRVANCVELTKILEEVFATKTRAEWFDIFNSQSFQYESIQSIADLVADPQMVENNYFVDVPYPGLGPVKMINVPFRLSETPGSIRSIAPEHGQHTEEVLTEILGYSWDKIAELQEKEAI
ncbi:MAG: CoA transferase [Chloroflexi bacterium]|nr:CoA transferase [Chloroflexota bacterium]